MTYNESIITMADSKASGPTHLITPIIDETDPEHPALPPVEMIADLSCDEALETGMGSRATIIWYREDWKTQSLVDVVSDGIRGVDWDSIAVDYDW